VVVLGHLYVKGAGSGVASESRRAWIYTLRDGNIVRHLTFAEPARAFEAVSLPEHDTEP
jgi:hypothetical protein